MTLYTIELKNKKIIVSKAQGYIKDGVCHTFGFSVKESDMNLPITVGKDFRVYTNDSKKADYAAVIISELVKGMK